MSSSFTGRTRTRTTRPSVRVFDRLARTLITVGGIGTIVAVLGVCFFLLWVAVPLFEGSRAGGARELAVPWGEGAPHHVALDESLTMGWALGADGTLTTFSLDDGAVLEQRPVAGGRRPTAVSVLADHPEVTLGFDDGSVAALRIGFETSFVKAGSLPAERVAALTGGAPVAHEGGMLSRSPTGQIRLERVRVEPLATRSVADGAVRAVDHVQGTRGPILAVLVDGVEGPSAYRLSGRTREDFLTGEESFELGRPERLPFPLEVDRPPERIALSGPGTDVYLAWRDGRLARIRVTGESPFLAERGVLPGEAGALTVLDFLLGNNTLLWGDTGGGLAGGFPVDLAHLDDRGLHPVERDRGRATMGFAATRHYSTGTSPVTSLAISGRSRLVLAGLEDGHAALLDGTSGARLARWPVREGGPIEHVALAPREDAWLAVADGRLYVGELDVGHPEASFASLFRPIWYEGYPEPAYIWQSSSGTDDFEPKLGLIPLIFGTLKATFYSMLFGAPLALLAATYTSEFLSPRARASIKPTIELMASLPSVVLGFLAALVIAPFVEQVVPATLAAFATVPVTLLTAAYLWQLLPPRQQRLHVGWRFPLMIGAVPLGLWLASVIGPCVEQRLFAGDLRAWLAWGLDRPGAEPGSPFASSTGGWLLLWLPLAAIGVSLTVMRSVNPRLRGAANRLGATPMAWLQLAKFALGVVLTLGIALVASVACNALGLDPRGTYIDTYVQRNALVVGFVMGFAIIPIIYTIADDALSTVPDHLRSASLAAGATPWQTATRIIIPTAMSGLFSALMIGLGRAVGETMIVLMAAGNTPVLEWNIFEGFRTLSANIAVELPEAVRDSTHYRTLFLAALVLFAMTFVVNTVAEAVRLRFRKRAYQL